MNPEKLETLILMMKTAVMGEVNGTYEWYVFRTGVQQDKPFDAFLLDLRELKKTCDICDHMDENSLKDQVIVGIQDDNLQEKLLQEWQLTLTKYIDMCCTAESASAQAKEMTASSAVEVNQVTDNKTWKRGARSFGNKSEKRECCYCGWWHVISAGACPAQGKKCGTCGEGNHFARKCPNCNSDEDNDPDNR